MGDWSIHIEGHGQHDNQGDEKDADVIAMEIIAKLLAAGQELHGAVFTSGSRKPLFVKGNTHGS